MYKGDTIYYEHAGELLKGKIVEEDGSDQIGIELEEAISEGHDCMGVGKAGHCIWGFKSKVISDDITKVQTIGEKYNPDTAEIDCWALIPHLLESEHAHRFLFHGPPGTGKTTAAHYYGNGGEIFCTTLHEEYAVAEFEGHWVPKENGGFDWVDGVASGAWKAGGTLVLNEIDLASGPVLTKCLAILDDLSIAGYDLPVGRIKPEKGFKVIATMNGEPEDLPDALRDRFDAIVNVDYPHPDATATLPDDLQYLVRHSYSNKGAVSLTFRQVQHFAEWREIIGTKHAAKLAFGDAGDDVVNLINIGVRSQDD